MGLGFSHTVRWCHDFYRSGRTLKEVMAKGQSARSVGKIFFGRVFAHRKTDGAKRVGGTKNGSWAERLSLEKAAFLPPEKAHLVP